MVNKGSNFLDFVRFHPHTYVHTQQSLAPLSVAIMFGMPKTQCSNLRAAAQFSSNLLKKFAQC